MKLDDKLLAEIENYCKINNIDNIEKYINNLLKQAFIKDKYSIIKINKFIDVNDNNEKDVVKEENNIEEKRIITKKEIKEKNNSFLFKEENEDE